MLVASRFRLGPKLGSGATGDVYRALDERSGEELAVKLASYRLTRDEACVRYDREAAALSVLASPHVVRFIAAGRLDDDDLPYLVLELLRGRTLQEELGAVGPLSAADVVTWLAQAGRALELAHGVGIVHRDLKPSNLFLHETPSGRVLKVLDFGLVKDLSQLRGDAQELVGTPLYMAPEQMRGQPGRIGPGTDIWALAIVAVTLLTGERYFSGVSLEELAVEIERAPLYPPSTRWDWLPPSFDVWFARATQRVVERRFRSVGEQVNALAVALRQAPAPSRARTDSRLGEASTVAARTPTPSIQRRAAAAMLALVGRQAEQAALEARLRPGTLVTLTGPAGVGKTCLAEAVCSATGERFPDGAWLVSLAAAENAEGLAAALASALALPADGTRATFEHVAAALAPRQALVVLDGFERLRSAAPALAQLHRACPSVAFLVTSRLRLGLAEEDVLTLEPLELPPPGIGAEEAHHYAAAELFLRRAQAAQPRFDLDDDNVDDVVGICRLVEGLPLALELAAAQLSARRIGEIRHRLAAAEPEHGHGDPVAGAIAWAYGLLDDGERQVLRYLIAAPGGLTLGDATERLAHLHLPVAAALIRLVEANLLVWSSSDLPRARMPESVRELCRAEARRLGEEDAIWRSALAAADALLARAEPALRGPDQDRWLVVLDGEHDNLRAVLAWAIAADPAAALRLAGRLAWYWYLRGNYEGGGVAVESALTRAATATRTGVGEAEDHLRALQGAGRLALLSCRYGRARELLGESRDLAVALLDRRGEADAEQLLGSVAREQADYAAAARHHRRSLVLWNELGDAAEALRARNYLDFLAWLGREPDAEPPVPEASAAAPAPPAGSDRESRVWWWMNRGAAAIYASHHERAMDALGQAFAESVAASFQEGIAWALNLLGVLSIAVGESVQARARLRASLRVHRRLGDLWRCASVLEALAALALDDGQPARAALYLGATEALRERLGTPVPACERPAHDTCLVRGLALMGAGGFQAGLERGRRLGVDQAISMATES
jgi:predicted ATPase